MFALLLAACAPGPAFSGDAQDSEEIGRLVFGVYAHVRSTEMVKKVAPLQRYLHRAMAARGLPVEIALRIFPTYSGAIEALANGQVDFVRFGPVSYVLAKVRNPEIRLLAMESNAGEKSFDGVISAPIDSSVRSVADLRGKRFAFGDRRSTTGRYLAQSALVKAGVGADDLADFAYLGRHDKVAFAVAAGSYDAGATNENTFHKYAREKGLREVLRFRCVTKPWVARSGLDVGIFQALRASLLKLQDLDVTKAINRSGFLPAKDADYDDIRKAMELAKQFETKSLTFALYASEKASEVYARVRPVLDRLQQLLAEQGRSRTIRIKVFRTYEEAIDALARGDVQLGRFGPASYLEAQSRNPAIRPLAREHSNREGSPQGVIVVPVQGPITELEQLKGRSFAFGSPLSTEGCYMAQAELLKAGITGVDLKGFSYLGRHDRVAYAVAAGEYDAGAMRETALSQNEVESRLRIIARFPVPNKVWIAWEGIDDELFVTLQQALLDMRDHEALRLLAVTGFAHFGDQEYEVVREGIRSAEDFSRKP